MKPGKQRRQQQQRSGKWGLLKALNLSSVDADADDVSGQDGLGWNTEIRMAVAWKCQFIDKSTGAGKLQQWKEITEVMVYCFSLA